MASERDPFRSHIHKSYLVGSSDNEAEVEDSMDLLIISVSNKSLPPFEK